MRASERYQNAVAKLVWKVYPRGLVKRFGRRLGLGMLIEAVK